jgi:hypothetical protein
MQLQNRLFCATNRPNTCWCRRSAPRLPISETTWRRLVYANEQVVRAGWAQRGVFATGVGPAYRPGHFGSLLYIGKSAGPLGARVRSGLDQLSSAQASKEWMIERKNRRSMFWRFIEKIDPSRQRIAWTNICKMDRKGGKRPPNPREWTQIAAPCIAALEEEIQSLKPHVTVFASSSTYGSEVKALLSRLNYEKDDRTPNLAETSLFRSPTGQYAVLTRHPQGWCRSERDPVIEHIERLLRGGT